MDINLTDETKRLIEGWIATGSFGSPEEVIQAAVNQLGPAEPPTETPTMESLRAKIMEGVHEIEAGRCGPIDIEDVIQRGEQRLRQRSEQ